MCKFLGLLVRGFYLNLKVLAFSALMGLKFIQSQSYVTVETIWGQWTEDFNKHALMIHYTFL